jgi:hypothetical protein
MKKDLLAFENRLTEISWPLKGANSPKNLAIENQTNEKCSSDYTVIIFWMDPNQIHLSWSPYKIRLTGRTCMRKSEKNKNF